VVSILSNNPLVTTNIVPPLPPLSAATAITDAFEKLVLSANITVGVPLAEPVITTT
jgi:hypothetical protein